MTQEPARLGNDEDEIERTILPPGSYLEAGGVYLDLNDPQRGPFKAVPGHEAGSRNRYIARRDHDATTWNRLVEHGAGEKTV